MKSHEQGQGASPFPYEVLTATELSQRNCLDVDGALHLADEALYRAKDRGRNRCEVIIQAPGTVVPIDQQLAAS